MLLPQPGRSVVAARAPGIGPGYWAGAPCAVPGDGEIFLAYRLRRPVGQGRGYAVAVARSTDGETFETLLLIGREDLAADSLERPALVRTPEGRWRLYLSCATPGTKHWRVEMTEAAHPAEFDTVLRHTILPCDAKTGVKDPVIRHHDGRWHLWASCHPLEDPVQADQMTTEYATSVDGLAWTWHGTALSGTPGRWDARGTRVTTVDFGEATVTAHYDGRASAAENYEERTGVATGTDPAALTSLGSGPLASSPYHGGGLRYLDIVTLPKLISIISIIIIGYFSPDYCYPCAEAQSRGRRRGRDPQEGRHGLHERRRRRRPGTDRWILAAQDRTMRLYFTDP